MTDYITIEKVFDETFIKSLFLAPIIFTLEKPYKTSKAPDGQGPLLTNYKPKL
jgi:hypothetical protein